MEHREKWLKNNGFKKVWFEDKSGYWWIKKVKIGEFNGEFYYDERFCLIYINTLDYCWNKWLKSDEVIWQGSWKAFKKKVLKYEV